MTLLTMSMTRLILHYTRYNVHRNIEFKILYVFKERCNEWEFFNELIEKENMWTESKSILTKISAFFFSHGILGISSGIDEIGQIDWRLLLCFLCAWVIVGLCICKGVKSVGKVIVLFVIFFLKYEFLEDQVHFQSNHQILLLQIAIS